MLASHTTKLISEVQQVLSAMLYSKICAVFMTERQGQRSELFTGFIQIKSNTSQ